MTTSPEFSSDKPQNLIDMAKHLGGRVLTFFSELDATPNEATLRRQALEQIHEQHETDQ